MNHPNYEQQTNDYLRADRFPKQITILVTINDPLPPKRLRCAYKFGQDG
jgi:hypothetical protein